MKKTLLINLIILFSLIALIEATLRFMFSYNVQGISKNLINKELNYRFNAPNLNYGKAFGVKIYTDKDGWTILTADGKASAHFEHTIAILEDGPQILSMVS